MLASYKLLYITLRDLSHTIAPTSSIAYYLIIVVGSIYITIIYYDFREL